MIETIWKKNKENEGSLFHPLGNNRLELRYRMIDENHLVFSCTAETVSKDSFRKVLSLLETLTSAQINKQIRASYYILAVLQDKRIRTEYRNHSNKLPLEKGIYCVWMFFFA